MVHHSEERTEPEVQLSLFERSAWLASSLVVTKKGPKDTGDRAEARGMYSPLCFLREFRNKDISPRAPSRWSGEEAQVENALEE